MRAWHVALIALPLLVAGAFPAAWLWRRRRARLAAEAERARVLEVACDSLRDIMVPDAAGGPVHIDYLLLTARGSVRVAVLAPKSQRRGSWRLS